MLRRLRFGLHPLEALVLVALVVWSVLPFVILFRHAGYSDTTITGVDNPVAGDQFQYFAWIRQEGEHFLSANMWDLARPRHVFLHPLFVLSGAAWRLGLSIPVAYLLWTPVAVGVLFGGILAYARRLLPAGTLPRVAAVVLALFYFVPLTKLLSWTDLGSPGSAGEAAGELFPSGQLWGYLPTAIAVGLMPLFLLAVERALDPSRRRPGRAAGFYIAASAAAGALVSWLHPWQGESLLVIAAAWIAWDRSWRRVRVLAIPMLATLAPLAYYFALSRWESAWELASKVPALDHYPLWVLAAGLAPLAALAGFGVRLRGADLQERALAIWPLATLLVYFATPSVPAHALQGMGIPLAVLAVRGWARLRVPAWLGAAAVAILTVPGTIVVVDAFRSLVSTHQQPFLITASEDQALSYTARSARPGGVLAPLFTALLVPSRTGRQVWVGHLTWTPNFAKRARWTDDLFNGRLAAGNARALVRSTGATVLISDCHNRANLEPSLRPLLAKTTDFGCATVYELRGRAK